MEKSKKKMIMLVVVLVTIASLAMSLIPKLLKITKEEPGPVLTNAQKFQQEYPGVPQNNRFVYKTVDQVIQLLKSGTGVVYFGFPGCPWCQEYVKYLEQVAQERGLTQISYYDIRQIRKDNTTEYQKIVSILEKHGLDKDEKGQPRIFVPEVVAVKDGKIIGRDNTTSLNSSDKDGAPADWWTEERITNVKQKLQQIIDPVIDCGTACQL